MGHHLFWIDDGDLTSPFPGFQLSGTIFSRKEWPPCKGMINERPIPRHQLHAVGSADAEKQQVEWILRRRPWPHVSKDMRHARVFLT